MAWSTTADKSYQQRHKNPARRDLTDQTCHTHNRKPRGRCEQAPTEDTNKLMRELLDTAYNALHWPVFVIIDILRPSTANEPMPHGYSESALIPRF